MLSLKKLLTEITKKIKNLDDNKINTEDTLCNFSINAAQNTDDGLLKSFLDTLGWTSTVVVNNNSKLSIKKTFFKILQRIISHTNSINNHTNSINNHTNSINNHTNRLNALETVTYTEGVFPTAAINKVSVNQCRLTKFGKFVFCDFTLRTKSTDDKFQLNEVVCNIPTGYRPTSNLLPGGTMVTSNAFHAARFHVNSDGNISAADYTNITEMHFTYFWRTS